MTSKRTWNPSEVQIGLIKTQIHQPRSRIINNINIQKHKYIGTSTDFSTLNDINAMLGDYDLQISSTITHMNLHNEKDDIPHHKALM